MNEGHIEYENLRLLPTPIGLNEEDVLIKFDRKKYGRRKRIIIQTLDDEQHPDDRKIDEFWEHKKKNNDRYFNQSKFRLSSCQHSINPKNNRPIVEIKVGITDYKVKVQC